MKNMKDQMATTVSLQQKLKEAETLNSSLSERSLSSPDATSSPSSPPTTPATDRLNELTNHLMKKQQEVLNLLISLTNCMNLTFSLA